MNLASDVLAALRTTVMEAHRTRTPLRLCGAGTKDFYGEGREGAPLDLTGYRGVVGYEPSELVLTARCGTPLSEIEALLTAERQFLAFEPPPLGGDPTIGGAIAAGLSGPRRAHAGAARDYVLGAVLLGIDGEVLRFGGQVMKNVAGFDVSRLLCGSLGILGPILEVSLKVMPLPREEQTLRFELSEAEALAAFNRWAGQPLPVSASAWWAGAAYLRLSGTAPALRAARTRLGGEKLDPDAAATWWRELRSQRHGMFGAVRNLWRLSVPSASAPLALDGARLIEWGGALRWCATDLPAAEVRNIATAAGGTALHWRGGAAGSRFHPLSAAVLAIHRRLKERFDPHGIFNQGRLVAGL
ncbi:MAG TPA: glycolate oxidase subunit GlcE [Steroidobacteraceae bacterium]|nr:glycolate oxidase subunit GlcE [Steroidobacteraceae bacterium]